MIGQYLEGEEITGRLKLKAAIRGKQMKQIVLVLWCSAARTIIVDYSELIPPPSKAPT